MSHVSAEKEESDTSDVSITHKNTIVCVGNYYPHENIANSHSANLINLTQQSQSTSQPSARMRYCVSVKW